jgi:hypothetical protein
MFSYTQEAADIGSHLADLVVVGPLERRNVTQILSVAAVDRLADPRFCLLRGKTSGWNWPSELRPRSLLWWDL